MRVILIAGPTANGKSGFALRLAEEIGGTVINADSMQVYRELSIITARPTAEEMARVPHRLYGFVPSAEAYSVGRYLVDAAHAIAQARAEGRVPIVVGGTGLYFKALLEGLSPLPAIDPEIRARLRARSEEEGAKSIAVIERDGALLDPKGLDIEDVRQWMSRHGGLLAGYPNATHVADGAAVLEEPCDILIPAALEGVIHLGNAERIKAPLIIEAANGPITFGADEVLRRKGCVIIPDMYANAGGVTVSYFEWVKNLSHIRFGRMQRRAEEARSRLLVEELERLSSDQGLGWSLAEGFKEKFLQGSDELALVRSGLDDTMRTAYQAMREVWHSRQDVEDLRVAAYIVSIGRVAQTYRSKGL